MTELEPLKFGRVKFRALAAVEDTTADPDSNPDAVTMTGTIVFAPVAPVLRVPTAVPVPTTVVPTQINAELDPEGYLIDDNGNRWISLLATNTGVTNPNNWAWRVDFNLKYNGVSYPIPSFVFELPEYVNPGDEIDLTVAMPVAADQNGVPIVQGPIGKSAYQSAVELGFIGTEAEWIASLEGPEGPSGFKIYASAAEVDAVGTTEQGRLRLNNQGALQAFFGAGGTDMFFGADIFIQSFLSDNYGSGFPPGASGRIQQVAYVDDGYGSHYVLTRSRGWDSGTGVWAAWDAWSMLPYPVFRPSAASLFSVGTAVDGSQDGFKPFYAMGVPGSGSAATEHAAHNYVPELWSTWFGHDFEMEKGNLKIKSAGFEFQGILDGARTDYGTVGFAARAANLQQQSNRVEATAGAAAVDAVTGFTIPVGLLTRYGIVFHATFSMQSGMTGNTRLLCGMVDRASIAAAMADNDPSAMQNFFAAGYGASDAGVSVYQKGTGSMSTGASTRAPSTSANQLIDFKAFITPNSGTLRYVLAIRTSSSNIDRITGVLGNNMANSLPMDFFIRASAGGTSATPKVALHRLRIGGGLGDVGGW